MERLLLVKYGEIHLKGLNRPFFKRLLKERLLEKVKVFNGAVVEKHGRIYVEGYTAEKEAEVIELCACTFGVVGVCPAVKVEKTLSVIGAAAVTELTRAMEMDGRLSATFKVHARREDKTFSPDSNGIAREVGGIVLSAMNQVRVDVHTPDYVVEVEVREMAYIYTAVVQGIGGMPIGSSGRAMLMISGGIDSPVAGYMIAKRGVTVSAVHFMSPPHTGEAAKQKTIELVRALSKYCGPIEMYLVRFTELQETLYTDCKHEMLTVLMRRAMIAISEKIAKKNKSSALITGESLGQVASQTMEAICATDAMANIPVFRPLIGMDKTEIIQIAKKINTFDISIRPGEDCCTVFVPRHPVTRPVIQKLEEEENRIDLAGLIEQCVETAEKIIVTPDTEI